MPRRRGLESKPEAERDATPQALVPTGPSIGLARRELLQLGAAGIATTGLGLSLACRAASNGPTSSEQLPIARRQELAGGEKPTPFEDATTYNNFYEFGTDKSDPARSAGTLRPRPWTIACEGEIKRPQRFDLDALIKQFPLEERIYRMRCVEAWSMVIPWVGLPLGDLIRRLEPTSRAKFVLFETLHDPVQLPNQRSSVLAWPYTEGLRLDEALHPLTLLAVGLYGRVLPNQNGAPIRLVVPWKYGFKGAKSIVKIRFQESMPQTTWARMAPTEYGFYANVNPEVDHPRWSQSRERRIGEFLKRKTLPFNGYAADVAHLYAGMDLRQLF